jgi:hypothetical protein
MNNTPEFEQLCNQVMEMIGQKIGPAFDMIGQRISALEKENSDLKDIVYSMITAMDEGVSSYKKNSLMNDLSSKYGADLEPFKGIYSDTRGSDLIEDLVNQLSDGEGSMDEKVPALIAELKGKFGKYLPGGASVTVEKTDIPADTEESEGPEASAPKEEDNGPAQVDLPFDKLKADLKKRMGM